MTKNAVADTMTFTGAPRKIFNSWELGGSSVNGTASRLSGVAPLSVHFESDIKASSPTESSFSSLHYVWSYGDTGSSGTGNWPNSGLARNGDVGPLAGHVYRDPGTYTAILSVYQVVAGTWVLLGQKFFYITVDDPDTVYAGTDTICVNPTGDSTFTGAPSGSDNVNAADWAAVIAYATTGKRVLIKKGTSWPTSTKVSPSGSSNVYIGTYGTGAKPIVTNNATGTASFLNLGGKEDFILEGIDFQTGTGAGSCVSTDSGTKRLLMIDVDTDGYANTLNCTTNLQGVGEYRDHIFVVECTGDNHTSHGMYTGGERMVFLGNTLERTNGSHLWRSWYSYKGVYQHNSYSGSAIAGTGVHIVKFHGPEDSEVKLVSEIGDVGTKSVRYHTRFNVFQYNIAGGGCPWMMGFGPQNTVQGEKIFDCIIEGNRLIHDYGVQSQQDSQIGFTIWGDYIIVRNNAIDLTGGQTANTSFIEFGVRGVEGPHVGCAAYHNSFYKDVDNDSGRTYRGIEVSSANVSDTQIGFNHMVLINAGSVTVNMVDDSGTNTNNIAGSNISETSSDSSASANMSDPENLTPASRSYQPAGSSTAIDVNVAAVAVRLAINGANRTQTQADTDAGAYNA